MKVDAAARALTDLQYRQQVALRARSISDARALWFTWTPGDVVGWERMVELAVPLVETRFDQSSAIARAYFEAMGLVETGKVVSAAAPVALEEARIIKSLVSSGLVGTVRGIAAGQSPQVAAETGFVRFSGAVSRLALEGGRTTILASVEAQGVRWERVTSSKPCAFCTMLASRGAVYVETTADFQSHDHCSCTAAPMFGAPSEISRFKRDPDTFSDQAADHRREWDEVTGTRSGKDALNAFRRAQRETTS